MVLPGVEVIVEDGMIEEGEEAVGMIEAEGTEVAAGEVEEEVLGVVVDGGVVDGDLRVEILDLHVGSVGQIEASDHEEVSEEEEVIGVEGALTRGICNLLNKISRNQRNLVIGLFGGLPMDGLTIRTSQRRK